MSFPLGLYPERLKMSWLAIHWVRTRCWQWSWNAFIDSSLLKTSLPLAAAPTWPSESFLYNISNSEACDQNLAITNFLTVMKPVVTRCDGEKCSATTEAFQYNPSVRSRTCVDPFIGFYCHPHLIRQSEQRHLLLRRWAWSLCCHWH